MSKDAEAFACRRCRRGVWFLPGCALESRCVVGDQWRSPGTCGCPEDIGSRVWPGSPFHLVAREQVDSSDYVSMLGLIARLDSLCQAATSCVSQLLTQRCAPSTDSLVTMLSGDTWRRDEFRLASLHVWDSPVASPPAFGCLTLGSGIAFVCGANRQSLPSRVYVCFLPSLASRGG